MRCTRADRSCRLRQQSGSVGVSRVSAALRAVLPRIIDGRVSRTAGHRQRLVVDRECRFTEGSKSAELHNAAERSQAASLTVTCGGPVAVRPRNSAPYGTAAQPPYRSAPRLQDATARRECRSSGALGWLAPRHIRVHFARKLAHLVQMAIQHVVHADQIEVDVAVDQHVAKAGERPELVRERGGDDS